MSFLTIKNLDKRFGAVEVLKNINLEIEKGDFLVLVGPSGCGKSTLLNTISGLERISAGDILLNGQSIVSQPPAKRDIAMVFQSYALYPNMTARGNISFGMEVRGVSKSQRDKAIAEVSEILQISHLLDRKPQHLSGGQRQRVAMGRALVRNPQLFLFDEPLSNLDAKLRVDMRGEMKRLHQRLQTTIVYVTHDQIEAMTLASKIAVIKDGVLQQFGLPATIYDRPVNTFVADFMGSPGMNLIPAKIVVRDGETFVVMTIGPDKTIQLKLPSNHNQRLNNGENVIFGLRPEALTDRQSADQRNGAIEYGESMVDIVEPIGSDTYIVTNIGGKQAIARLRHNTGIVPGQTLSLAFNMNKAIFFDADTGKALH